MLGPPVEGGLELMQHGPGALHPSAPTPISGWSCAGRHKRMVPAVEAALRRLDGLEEPISAIMDFQRQAEICFPQNMQKSCGD